MIGRRISHPEAMLKSFGLANVTFWDIDVGMGEKTRVFAKNAYSFYE